MNPYQATSQTTPHLSLPQMLVVFTYVEKHHPGLGKLPGSKFSPRSGSVSPQHKEKNLRVVTPGHLVATAWQRLVHPRLRELSSTLPPSEPAIKHCGVDGTLALHHVAMLAPAVPVDCRQPACLLSQAASHGHTQSGMNCSEPSSAVHTHSTSFPPGIRGM